MYQIFKLSLTFCYWINIPIKFCFLFLFPIRYDKDSHSINLPGCKSTTEEVQHGLDLISQYHKLSSSTSTPSLLSISTNIKREKEVLTSQQNQNNAECNFKDAHNLGSGPFQDLLNTESFNHKRNDNTMTDPSLGNLDLSHNDQFPSQHNSNVVENLTNDRLLPQRTPQTFGRNPSSVLNAMKGDNRGSAVKFHRWHSASVLQESSKRPTVGRYPLF